MASSTHLTRAAADFLAELRDNNNRAWFLENRDRAEELLLSPARSLVVEVGELLRKKRPDIIADPRTDRSIYRLNRDTRFSRDKTPYKTHLALWWWEGLEGRLECPGFYYHLTPDGWGWSIGCYRFSESGLNGWRQSLLDAAKAKAFRRVISDFEKTGAPFGAPELKRAPAGFSPDHPMIQYLRHKGFYSWAEESPHPPELFGPDAAEFIYDRFATGLKLHDWLVKTLAA
ncbi:MAG: DUF2461 domain-containing protein [Candidatus Adiutrix sp.]|jgi:uncharacterized protein (TIGR02453 family)|nr:DUF2461 domain-containing protein [Candidatus Adiutrix sp.]